MPDPVAHAVNCMLDHIHKMDQQMHNMREAIDNVGGHVDGAEVPEIEPCDIESTSPGEEEPDTHQNS